MFIEKKRKGVSSRLFTSDGTKDGIVTVSNARDFFVKQRVQIASDTQSPITVEIKRFVSNTSFRVGPIGDSINSKTDISNYLTTDSARISAEEQDRPGITDKDYNRAVYAEEPIVAKRIIQVDEFGNYYNLDNPLPIQSVNETAGWDEIDVSYPDSTSDLFTYKKEGITIETILITYVDSTKNEIDLITKTEF